MKTMPQHRKISTSNACILEMSSKIPEHTFNPPYIGKILFALLTLLFCIATTTTNASPNENNSPQSFSIHNDQIDDWMGREQRLTHPVVKNLQYKNVENLHFHFDQNYAHRAEAIISSAKLAKFKITRFLPIETVNEINIYLLDDINKYFEALNAPGKAPNWAAGLAILRDGVILIRLKPNGFATIEPTRTLAHELNHIALHRFKNNQDFPHWFYEGFAMLATEEWNFEKADTLAKAAIAGKLLELDEINLAFSKYGSIVELAYAQSASFVHWLDNHEKNKNLNLLLEKVHKGTPFDQAFIETYGRSPKAAFALWKNAFTKNNSAFATLFSPESIFFGISILAAVALSLAVLKRRKIVKNRNKSFREIPISELPKNLRNFGPFFKKR